MTWSTAPAAPLDTKRAGWWINPPPQAVASSPGWYWAPAAIARSQGDGSGVAPAVPTSTAHSTGAGSGVSHAALTSVVEAVSQSAGAGSAFANAKVIGSSGGFGASAGAARAKPVGTSEGSGRAVGSVVVRQVAAAIQAGGSGAAASRFSSMPPATQQITAAGVYTYSIPVWCRFIDILVLGAGGGGNEGMGAFQTGGGGGEGAWQTLTLERGVHLSWGTSSITGSVGVGGDGGKPFTAAVNGQPSTAAYQNLSGTSVTATANGGTKGKGQLVQQPGYSPGSQTINGQTYSGGTGGTGNGGTGGIGAGGAGGNGGAFSGSPGGKGGNGSAWFRAYQ